MKIRIRIPDLDGRAREVLARRAHLFLGRHAAAVDVVEISRARERSGAIEHTECELVVKLRDGGAIRVHDDGNHVHRALLRAVWRLDQRRELSRLRDGAPNGVTGRAP
jgi:hypothetical protein